MFPNRADFGVNIMNVKRILTGLVVVIVLAMAGTFIFQQFIAADEVAAATESDGEETLYAETAVQVGDRAVSAEGVIVPRQSANLSFLMGGELAEILAEEGTVVAAGDPILRLDAANLELGVQQAQAGLTVAQASLAAAQAQLELAQVRINTAEIGVTSARAQLDLVQSGARSEELEAAMNMIKEITQEAEVGAIYEGTVVKTTDFGAFVQILPGTDGLVYISQLANYRVKKVTDIVKEGDRIKVKVLEIGRDGKIRLSHKAVKEDE
jgi:multidrug efflux pump subunit AcrA (membrane-fusion protein)